MLVAVSHSGAAKLTGQNWTMHMAGDAGPQAIDDLTALVEGGQLGLQSGRASQTGQFCPQRFGGP